MSAFSELTPVQLEDIRHYIRTAAHDTRAAEAGEH